MIATAHPFFVSPQTEGSKLSGQIPPRFTDNVLVRRHRLALGFHLAGFLTGQVPGRVHQFTGKHRGAD